MVNNKDELKLVSFLIVSKKYMFLCVFAGARRNDEIAKFQFLIPVY